MQLLCKGSIRIFGNSLIASKYLSRCMFEYSQIIPKSTQMGAIAEHLQLAQIAASAASPLQTFARRIFLTLLGQAFPQTAGSLIDFKSTILRFVGKSVPEIGVQGYATDLPRRPQSTQATGTQPLHDVVIFSAAPANLKFDCRILRYSRVSEYWPTRAEPLLFWWCFW